jgi:UDP-N-acetylmuramoylalanine--D-glutamate ligase
MNFLRDTPVLILGLGASGLAMARWCVRHGAQVSVWDSRARAPQDETLARELPGVQRLTALPLLSSPGEPEPLAQGASPASSVSPSLSPSPSRQRYRLVLKSPGLAPHDERIAPVAATARATGLAVMGELDLFAHALADLKTERGYAPQVLAITGTNGKTTVTAMTALLVARAGKTVAMAGNIGPTLLDTLQAQLDAVPGQPARASMQAARAVEGAAESVAGVAAERAAEGATQGVVEVVAETPTAALAPAEPASDVDPDPDADAPPALPQVWVLELSSFQLEGGGHGVQGFEPAAAVVLNVTQDHLDWHGSMAAYTAAKARVYGRHAVMVVNRDDPVVQALPQALSPKPPSSGGKGKVQPPAPRRTLGFGMTPPTRPEDFGIQEQAGMAWLVRALPADETFKRKKGEPEEDLHLQRLMPADALRVRGRHNAANALAALALASAVGCPLAPMLHGLRSYGGEPHRVQFVLLANGVEVYDDSKGTNVGATVAALAGLGADKAPGRLLVVLGGDGKGQDFSPLVAPLAQRARAVATIGRDAAAIEAVLAAHAGTAALPRQRFATLPEATLWCLNQAQSGDAVLLSPACASLDMFDNYAHRAQVFVQAAQAWAAERGQA